MTERPLVYLDVDGTLLPLGGATLPNTLDGWTDWQLPSNPQLANVDATHGPRLLALPCDLMWATAWRHDANDVIAPLLGLPTLPVVGLPDEPDWYATDTVHWKTAALIDTAAGRPFVWIDDEITDLDRAWVTAHHDGDALLHRVDSMIGLTGADLTIVTDWLHDTVFPTTPETRRQRSTMER